jgi:uncharacterized protein YecE (DUF72 family)
VTKDTLAEKIHTGTSGWSYKDWVGPFYAEGTVPGDYLARYSEQFRCVEVDMTFYRIPSVPMVEGWAKRTPEDFRFALKVPSLVTHGAQGEQPVLEKVLVDEERNLETFLEVLEPLGAKLGPVVFQFPYFRVKEMAREDFLERLERTLEKLPADRRFAVEIRNKGWITPDYLDLLSRHKVAAVMIDHPYMPWPRQQLAMGMVTTDFAYVRLLGDRHAIEKTTQEWDKVVVDKSRQLREWAEVLRKIVEDQGIGAAWVFANNHFAGHGPASSRQLMSYVLGEATEVTPPPASTSQT